MKLPSQTAEIHNNEQMLSRLAHLSITWVILNNWGHSLKITMSKYVIVNNIAPLTEENHKIH